jgi:hypothetical protein
VVTVKLSENEEYVNSSLYSSASRVTMIVEKHIHMNYSSGQWKIIKRYRRLEYV